MASWTCKKEAYAQFRERSHRPAAEISFNRSNGKRSKDGQHGRRMRLDLQTEAQQMAGASGLVLSTSSKSLHREEEWQSTSKKDCAQQRKT
jgi:hypothetical protein